MSVRIYKNTDAEAAGFFHQTADEKPDPAGQDQNDRIPVTVFFDLGKCKQKSLSITEHCFCRPDLRHRQMDAFHPEILVFSVMIGETSHMIDELR